MNIMMSKYVFNVSLEFLFIFSNIHVLIQYFLFYFNSVLGMEEAGCIW